MNKKNYQTFNFVNGDTQIPFWKCNFFGHYVKSEPENSLQTLICCLWLYFKTAQAPWHEENFVEVIEVNFPCWN